MQVQRIGIRVGLSIGLLLGLATRSQFAQAQFAQAQFAQAQRLPPPPNVPVLPSLPAAPLPVIPVSPTPSRQIPDATPNERVYTAPRDPLIQPVGRFRVFVDTDSPIVLQRVRSIQPDAFIQNLGGRRVIQAGLFSDELKARQQVSRLAVQDIPAQMTGRSPQFGDAERGYYAVVPGNSSEVRDYRDRAIRFGLSQSLVQVRERPRGLHLAVGAFANEREAQRVVQYLRDRGMDARLFYDR
ncbi:MAG TPA: hypothetical protein VL134_06655 [Leptolyngbya sp.]|nr:hypothetical protein [Leptolyngbya sp.]